MFFASDSSIWGILFARSRRASLQLFGADLFQFILLLGLDSRLELASEVDLAGVELFPSPLVSSRTKPSTASRLKAPESYR